jgi:hypothetical protein
MSWRKWFKKCIRESSIKTTEVVGLHELKSWNTTEEAVRRSDGAFYEVIGVRGQWDQPMIRSTAAEPTHGVVILVAWGTDCLIQAKAEPGYAHLPGHMVLTATVQASHESLRRENIPYADLKSCCFEEYPGSISRRTVPQDGGMFYMKRNEYAAVFDNPGNAPLANYRWMSLEELAEAAMEGLVSEHLLQCLGIMHLMLGR